MLVSSRCVQVFVLVSAHARIALHSSYLGARIDILRFSTKELTVVADVRNTTSLFFVTVPLLACNAYIL